MLKKTAKSIDGKFLNPAEIYTGCIIGSSVNEPTVNFVVTKVFYRTNDYAIFEINNSGYIEYISVDDAKYNTQAISLPLNRINFWLDGTPNEKLYGFQESFADALAMCFEGRPSEALFTIAQLEAMVKNEVFKNSKFIYISTFAGFCLLLILMAVLFKYTCLSNYVNPEFRNLFYIGTMGALGGLLSVSRNLDNYNVEIKSSESIWAMVVGPHLVGIITRLTVSILGAVLIYVLARANIVATPFDIKKDFFLLMALATVAGFSESLIPGLLTKFETNISAGEPLRVKQNANQSVGLGPGALNPVSAPQNNSTGPADATKMGNDDAVG